MARAPYQLTMPERRRTGVVFASPHSGRDYPAQFLRTSVLDERTIRSSEDAFVDTLLDGVPALGAPLLAATVPRAFLDLNRAADELDPALIDGVRLAAHNPRVASGLGVIPRVVAGGRAIYRGKMSRDEAEARIDAFWRPYHGRLADLLETARGTFGEAILVDMHSMPHEAMDSIASAGARRPEIVLGDRFGAAAAPHVMDRIEAAFERAGFRTLRNAPFAGAYITQTYGRPSRGFHAVQIEIDRALYMNEREVRPNGNFMSFRRTLHSILADIAEIGRGEISLAAE
ncbi:MAG: N-formylglutamate amidohydrolase [Rhodobacteraceae bacterium]|nr:N-formylglutamate amidohydrolase [Paracoccaceae bacterium]